MIAGHTERSALAVVSSIVHQAWTEGQKYKSAISVLLRALCECLRANPSSTHLLLIRPTPSSHGACSLAYCLYFCYGTLEGVRSQVTLQNLVSYGFTKCSCSLNRPRLQKRKCFSLIDSASSIVLKRVRQFSKMACSRLW
jgi:hypothetical protein